ncbi:MAG: metal ABC transporter ATP-binding protein [Actinomycetales bacterium]|nr:metal ABC transporter ATP-binding protein [Actinomycetales bacterium]
MTSGAGAPPLRIAGAELSFGTRTLWRGLDLDLQPGEFVAVLGPNGAGKTSLLRAVLGLQPLSDGRIEIAGHPARRGDRGIGYVPQQRPLPPGTALRARDLVAFGVDGTRFGLPWARRGTRARVDALLAEVGAERYAREPVGSLSGGEQQRLRIAQALAGDPALLLCDEPLLSLDLAQQARVAELLQTARTERGAAVLFVTHDVNPVLDQVDRVLYLADGRHRLGAPEEVLRGDVLSELYGTPVEVLRSGGRLLVVGGPDGAAAAHHEHEHLPGLGRRRGVRPVVGAGEGGER